MTKVKTNNVKSRYKTILLNQEMTKKTHLITDNTYYTGSFICKIMLIFYFLDYSSKK